MSSPAAAPADDLLGDAIRTWRGDAPLISAKKLLRIHKYTDPSKVRPMIVEAAEKAVQNAARISQPEARYVVTPIETREGETLELAGGVRFAGPDFETLLPGCAHLLAFVMTIGPELDRQSLYLVEQVFEPLDALFLQTAGWLVIEAASRDFAAELKRRAAAQGVRLSMRLGPGYDYPEGDSRARVRWDLEQQEQLFQLFRGATLPVELMLPSCAMLPKMSRSGVFGLAPHA